MKRYFMEGGPLFMGILTFIFLVILVMVVYYTVAVMKREVPEEKLKYRLTYIRKVGLFALVFGIFGQLLGLYMAFDVIQELGDVSPAILAGGIKVSMLSTLYGVVIYLLSWLFWFGLEALNSRK